MANEEGTERALTWADNFIYGLLGDAEKHQAALRDISDDAIRSTINKLDTTSEEFLAGLNVLTYQADLEVKKSFAEAEEQIGEQAFSALTLMATGITETDDETWERIFDIERDLDKAKNEADKEIDKLVDDTEDKQNDILATLEEGLLWLFDGLWEPIWEWGPELVADAEVYLAGLPAKLLFESFKNFFFEED